MSEVSITPPRTAGKGAFIVLACASPVVLLAAAWWYVNAVLLVPAVPTEKTDAETTIDFYVDAKGLHRLEPDAAWKFLFGQMHALSTDDAKKQGFVTALRRRSPDEQEAFGRAIFDIVLPRMMDDARRFAALTGEKEPFLDGRLIEYARLESMLRSLKPDRGQRGGLRLDQQLLQKLILEKTSEEDRVRGQAYITALGARFNEILADEELKAKYEKQMQELPPP